MLEESADVLVSTLGKPGTRWKFAHKGTIFDKKPVVGKDSVHIFKDFTHVYCNNRHRKKKKKVGIILWVRDEAVQEKLTQKEEAIAVRKFYNDRGRESIDWSEAEALQNTLKDAATGVAYSFLPHSLWKKHLSGSKKIMVAKNDTATTAPPVVVPEKKRFTFDQDVRMMKKWAKHATKHPQCLSDPAVRTRILEKMKTLKRGRRGYSSEDDETFVDYKARKTPKNKK